MMISVTSPTIGFHHLGGFLGQDSQFPLFPGPECFPAGEAGADGGGSPQPAKHPAKSSVTSPQATTWSRTPVGAQA